MPASTVLRSRVSAEWVNPPIRGSAGVLAVVDTVAGGVRRQRGVVSVIWPV